MKIDSFHLHFIYLFILIYDHRNDRRKKVVLYADSSHIMMSVNPLNLSIKVICNRKCVGREKNICFSEYLNTLKGGVSQYYFFRSVSLYGDKQFYAVFIHSFFGTL